MLREEVDRFFVFAEERHNIHLRREVHHEPAPWTTDPILQTYRFCNIYRELDRTTLWMRDNLTRPIGHNHRRQLLAAVIFRWFNKIETGELLLDMLVDGTWDPDEALRRLNLRTAAGLPILNGAYMIKSPPGKKKAEGLIECINMVWHATDIGLGEEIAASESLEWAHRELQRFPYLGHFMAYEIVCDLRHSPVLNTAKDIMTWTSPGPGAARGASRLLAATPEVLSYHNAEHRAKIILMCLELVRIANGPNGPFQRTRRLDKTPLWEMREAEHTLCEFDKYERSRLGEGTPKQYFKPRKD